jgi:tRNA-specific 2-thiouridylase
VDHVPNANSRLIRSADKNKDQTYFLWRLSQEQLSRTLFPVGNMIKSETRKIAERHNMPVANKPDSQEVCFIPDNDYRNFLRTNIPDIVDKIGEGDVILNGKFIGKHKGYPFYTIGQRKGLGISFPEPIFVKDIIPESNTIVVSTESELMNRALEASTVNIIADVDLTQTKRYLVKIRYRDPGSFANCKLLSDGRLLIEFEEDKKSITPGQSVVMYDGDEVIGGGIIEKRL